MAFLHSRTPLLLLLATAISALALHQTSLTTRRGILLAPTTAFVAAAACLLGVPDESLASSTRRSSTAPDLVFATAPSDLQYADAKVGTGQPVAQKGSSVTIDYVMSTTGARYGSKIYSTADKGSPYKFNLGDGTTIAGLQEAIAGGPGVNPMQPGGIRRVIIPSKLAYESLAYPIAGMQFQDCQQGKGVGPIPPAGEGTAGEYFQRFKNIYCNANRPYQPDLVMDVKLYGKR